MNIKSFTWNISLPGPSGGGQALVVSVLMARPYGWILHFDGDFQPNILRRAVQIPSKMT